MSDDVVNGGGNGVKLGYLHCHETSPATYTFMLERVDGGGFNTHLYTTTVDLGGHAGKQLRAAQWIAVGTLRANGWTRAPECDTGNGSALGCTDCAYETLWAFTLDS